MVEQGAAWVYMREEADTRISNWRDSSQTGCEKCVRHVNAALNKTYLEALWSREGREEEM